MFYTAMTLGTVEVCFSVPMENNLCGAVKTENTLHQYSRCSSAFTQLQALSQTTLSERSDFIKRQSIAMQSSKVCYM